MKKNSLLFIFFLFFYGKNYAQYYNAAFGLNGTALKTQLHNIIKNHNTQAWPLWSYFYNTDAKGGTEVWDIYSDVPGGAAPYSFTLGANQCGTYSSESDCYNHEHTWPSTYFNDVTPMRTDLHHVYATDGFVNNKRSSYPYGKVTAPTWTSQNGSKLGNGTTYAGYTDKIFEPIDSFKGDLARSYFYMSTRYEGEDAGWSNWTMANGAQLTQEAITLLLNWHQNDPVSQKEINRNNAIFQIQNNRNPFIDYPLFADCIWGIADCISIGFNDISKGNTMKFYPVPAQDVLTVEYATKGSLYSWFIYDITGKKLMHCSNVGNLKQNEQIDISKLSSGTYLLLTLSTSGTSKNIFEKK